MSRVALIGPIGAGKSTQAELLAAEIGLPRCAYDKVKWDYLNETGFDHETALEIQRSEGMYAFFAHINQFVIRILRPIVEDHPRHIIDFGGGAHCFDHPGQIAEAQRVFSRIGQVFLLKPSKGLATCVTTLPGIRERFAMNTYFIMHSMNELLAEKTFYIGQDNDGDA